MPTCFAHYCPDRCRRSGAVILDVFLFGRLWLSIIWGFHTWLVTDASRGRVDLGGADRMLDNIRTILDADAVFKRTVILRAMTQELGPTREAVLEAVVQRLDLSQKHAAEAYTLAEHFETRPWSVWGYVQRLTRLSRRTPWQDGRFRLDRAASRLLATVN